MSHFITHVFVPEIGKQPGALQDYLDKVMEPFDENKEVEPYINETLSINEMKEIVKKYGADQELDEFLDGWYGEGRAKLNTEKQVWEIWTTYNPDSQWDWWSIGGRWNDFFNFTPKTKEEREKEHEEAGIFAFLGSTGGKNIVKVGELDWQPKRNLALKEANDEYDLFEEAVKDLTLTHRWKDLVEKVEAGEMSWDEARDTYSSQKWVIEAKKAVPYLFTVPEQYFKVNEGGREAFLTDKLCGIGVPYSFIDLDGNWHQKGKMGWFGMSSDDQTQQEWADHYFAYLNGLIAEKPETLIVSLDLHI
jgi:hypothetical protein